MGLMKSLCAWVASVCHLWCFGFLEASGATPASSSLGPSFEKALPTLLQEGGRSAFSQCHQALTTLGFAPALIDFKLIPMKASPMRFDAQWQAVLRYSKGRGQKKETVRVETSGYIGKVTEDPVDGIFSPNIFELTTVDAIHLGVQNGKISLQDMGALTSGYSKIHEVRWGRFDQIIKPVEAKATLKRTAWYRHVRAVRKELTALFGVSQSSRSIRIVEFDPFENRIGTDYPFQIEVDVATRSDALRKEQIYGIFKSVRVHFRYFDDDLVDRTQVDESSTAGLAEHLNEIMSGVGLHPAEPMPVAGASLSWIVSSSAIDFSKLDSSLQADIRFLIDRDALAAGKAKNSKKRVRLQLDMGSGSFSMPTDWSSFFSVLITVKDSSDFKTLGLEMSSRVREKREKTIQTLLTLRRISELAADDRVTSIYVFRAGNHSE